MHSELTDTEFTDTEQSLLIHQQSPAPELESNLFSQLKCRKCKKYRRPPIVLCARGCKVCGICNCGYGECQTCESSSVIPRSLALENLARQVKYPCEFLSYGCTETFNYDTIGGHQVICRYIPQTCPVAKLALGNCDWTGIYSEMEKHLKENHLELCYEYVEGDSKFLYSLDTQTKSISFIFAYNAIFYSLFVEESGNCSDFML